LTRKERSILNRSIQLRYSEAFKLKVVDEIEKGRYSEADVRKVYGINGGATVSRWLRKYGFNDDVGKVIRIEMKDERDKIKQLEKEKHELERALAKTQVKVLAYEALIDIAKEDYGIDLKKNGMKESKE